MLSLSNKGQCVWVRKHAEGVETWGVEQKMRRAFGLPQFIGFHNEPRAVRRHKKFQQRAEGAKLKNTQASCVPVSQQQQQHLFSRQINKQRRKQNPSRYSLYVLCWLCICEQLTTLPNKNAAATIIMAKGRAPSERDTKKTKTTNRS